MAPLQWMAERHIERQISDPALRAKVTPDYTIGGKRILLGSDYYPALTRPNVDLVTDPIVRITETGLACAAGSAYDVDVIIYGTGFKTVEAVAELNVAGRDGVKLQDMWRDGIEAYHGIAVAGFPNFFLLLGPNTGLGHNSVMLMIESQVQHVMSCLRLLARQSGKTIEVRASRCAASTTGSSAAWARPCGLRAAVRAGTWTPTASTVPCGRIQLRVLGTHQARAPRRQCDPVTNRGHRWRCGQ